MPFDDRRLPTWLRLAPRIATVVAQGRWVPLGILGL
jgi:hypothetical protein